MYTLPLYLSIYSNLALDTTLYPNVRCLILLTVYIYYIDTVHVGSRVDRGKLIVGHNGFFWLYLVFFSNIYVETSYKRNPAGYTVRNNIQSTLVQLHDVETASI